jgi:5-oxoprolinase (ATP-hydrolysing)
MAMADVVHEETIPCSFPYEIEYFDEIDRRINDLKSKCKSKLLSQGFADNNIDSEVYLNMRYEKTDFACMTQSTNNYKTNSVCSDGNFKQAFLGQYQRQFGFTLPNRTILVDDIRVRGIASYNILKNVSEQTEKCLKQPLIDSYTQCFFENIGFTETPVILMSNLYYGHELKGPCIIIDPNFTVLVEPNCTAIITSQGNIKIIIDSNFHKQIDTNLDPIHLSIFSHRFMSIAEQMGRVLQRTSISTNIKERLDFSCALFGPDGGLVCNMF